MLFTTFLYAIIAIVAAAAAAASTAVIEGIHALFSLSISILIDYNTKTALCIDEEVTAGVSATLLRPVTTTGWARGACGSPTPRRKDGPRLLQVRADKQISRAADNVHTEHRVSQLQSQV
ncbi:uncharacterized protein BDR25DRAFT_319688 [Lindgomyces ingoldianus]|uniref:Uncharacterized protein n=1 Tax=Lindgomyces ingoldianus TaxID=673940 RepID=A0ACB6QA05_9PLEO|nr:uncharacterized protein BDR25DRAFT_319688 [Lindgomyces ingoldianus]KAF2463788.1 hypothetical protein BDR25DRAFT_319688 [Lindgomyces ingoldianus]